MAQLLLAHFIFSSEDVLNLQQPIFWTAKQLQVRNYHQPWSVRLFGYIQERKKSSMLKCLLFSNKRGLMTGVFAIAFAVEVAFGGNPSKVIYKQEEMRNHFEDSFKNRQLSPFPRGEMGKKSVRKLAKIEVHCLCFLPKSYDSMVECEDCFTWFHHGCVNYLETDKNCGWKCVDCSPKKKKQKFQF